MDINTVHSQWVMYLEQNGQYLCKNMFCFLCEELIAQRRAVVSTMRVMALSLRSGVGNDFLISVDDTSFFSTVIPTHLNLCPSCVTTDSGLYGER